MSEIHPLEYIEVRVGERTEVMGLIRLLPRDTFRHTEDFIKSQLDYESVGRCGIYAKQEPLLGDRGVSLIVVDEHLFGNPMDSSHHPTLRIPDGATDIYLVPPRQPPLKERGSFAGVEFNYQGARFFFGYELSPTAYKTIRNSIRRTEPPLGFGID